MKTLLAILLASLFCCMSCGSDDAVDPGRPAGSPPQIADLNCDPTAVTVGEGSGATTVDCTVSFSDADQDLETILVRFRQNCGTGSWQEIPNDVIAQTAGRTQGQLDFDFIAETNCPASNYPYDITAEDSTGRVSVVLTLQFLLEDPAP